MKEFYRDITIKPETSGKQNSPYGLFLPPVLTIAGAFIVYLPVINRYFVSDDFSVLNRICLDHIILIKWFFRPLSDLTILMNYHLDHFNPIVFNAFNILIHGLNVYVLYLICLNFGQEQDKKTNSRFAFISALLFLIYPFHNEAVVWLLGRGASMACLFALLSVLSYYKIRQKVLKAGVVCSFYFISMLAFETTMIFPLIFIFILIFEKTDIRSIRKWMVLLLFTLCFHLLLRYYVSESIFGTYGQDFFHSGIKIYFLNVVRVGSRLIFPPLPYPALLLFLFIICVGAIIYTAYKKRDKINHSTAGRMLLFLTGMLIISCFVPFVTGVSTRTSETDRLLYFPSVFLCMMVATLILHCITRKAYRFIAMALIIVYSLFFLQKNNRNWMKASMITRTVVEKINDNENQSTSYFLNMPTEINGAYVFRMGFADAIRLCGKDNKRFVVVNYLHRQESQEMNERLKMDTGKSDIIFQPDIELKTDSSGCKKIFDHGRLKFISRPGDHLYFWNFDQLESIQPCTSQFRG